MIANRVDTGGYVVRREEERKGIIQDIMNGVRDDVPAHELASRLEELVGNLAGLIEFDYAIQGSVQELINNYADLVGEKERCEALFEEYGL